MLHMFSAIVLPFQTARTLGKTSAPNPRPLYGLTPQRANLVRSPRLNILAANRKGKSTDGMFLQVHGFVSRGVFRGNRSSETIRTYSGCRGRDAHSDKRSRQCRALTQ